MPAWTPDRLRAPDASMNADASPLAQRIARLSGIDLDTVSSVDGRKRIRARDVLATLSPAPADLRPADPGTAAIPAGAPGAGRSMRLESSCRARSLFEMAAGLGGESAARSFEHAVLFIVARSLWRMPGLMPTTDREGGAAVRLGILADDGPTMTLSWNPGMRRIAHLSRAARALGSGAAGAQPLGPDGNHHHVVVRFVATFEVTDRSDTSLESRAPNLTVLYDPQAASVDLVLRWNARYANERAAADFISELRRLIEEPRRLLL